MVSVKLVDVSKRYDETVAVDSLGLDVKDKEFITLLGPSGCGKTTTLKMIAGLLSPDSGSIYFDDKLMNEVPPHKRNVGLCFQNYALFPHMNVFKNVAFGLVERKWPKNEIRKKVREVLKLVNLEEFEDRFTHQLSGGQQQRVAAARALAIDPDVLLMDEPLSNLDAKLRVRVREDLRKLQKETMKTTIYVTHDQEEALVISDRIALMKEGKIEQIDEPYTLYKNPRTGFAADFVGKNNIFEGTVKEIDEDLTIDCQDLTIKASYDGRFKKGSDVLICIRPENIKIVSESDRQNYKNILKGKIETTTFLGSLLYVVLNVEGHLLMAELHGVSETSKIKIGDETLIGFNEYVLVS